MGNLKIYLILGLSAIRCKMEYKVSFLFFVLAIFVYYFSQLGIIWVVVGKFNSIGGWNLGEMTFLYGLFIFSQGITSLCFNSLNSFEDLIINGDFDRFLVRPLSPLCQILCTNFEIASIAHFVIGGTALIFGSYYANVSWSLPKGLFLIPVIIGAVFIQGGIRIIVASITFWTTKNRALVHTVVYSSKEFIHYPISIYNSWVKVFLTFIFPLAFVNFYPANYFLDSSERTLFHPILQYFTPLVGVVIFYLSCTFWKIGINKYQSTGN